MHEATDRRERCSILTRAPRVALYERARILRIRGRSRMTKRQLADALIERVDTDPGLAEVLRIVMPGR